MYVNTCCGNKKIKKKNNNNNNNKEKLTGNFNLNNNHLYSHSKFSPIQETSDQRERIELCYLAIKILETLILSIGCSDCINNSKMIDHAIKKNCCQFSSIL